jgi:hypothetical protein
MARTVSRTTVPRPDNLNGGRARCGGDEDVVRSVIRYPPKIGASAYFIETRTGEKVSTSSGQPTAPAHIEKT